MTSRKNIRDKKVNKGIPRLFGCVSYLKIATRKKKGVTSNKGISNLNNNHSIAAYMTQEAIVCMKRMSFSRSFQNQASYMFLAGVQNLNYL